MNQVVMAGRIATAPRHFRNDNSQLCSFRLAVKGNYKSGDEAKTEFFQITTWGGLAEACAKHLALGREITVNGRLRNRSYSKDGKTQWTTEIIAEEVEFMGSRKASIQKSTEVQEDSRIQTDPELLGEITEGLAVAQA